MRVHLSDLLSGQRDEPNRNYFVSKIITASTEHIDPNTLRQLYKLKEWVEDRLRGVEVSPYTTSELEAVELQLGKPVVVPDGWIWNTGSIITAQEFEEEVPYCLLTFAAIASSQDIRLIYISKNHKPINELPVYGYNKQSEEEGS